MTDQLHHRQSGATDTADCAAVIGEFCEVLDTIMRSVPQLMSRRIAEQNITMLQFYALKEIAACGTDIDMSTISASTGFPASSITSIVDRLDQLELVERRHDKSDRRRVVASITPRGAAVLKQLKQERNALLGEVFDQSPAGDLAVCVDVFQRVQQRVDEMLRART
jgi:DNA-binding MarR family transcriptional regulator